MLPGMTRERAEGPKLHGPWRRDKLRPVAASLGGRALDDPLKREQKYPVLLEYAKASFERIKQRLRHL